jgi:hypothetical protein
VNFGGSGKPAAAMPSRAQSFGGGARRAAT